MRNIEKHKEAKHRWYLENKKLTCERSRMWRINNPEKSKESKKKTEQRHPWYRFLKSAIGRCSYQASKSFKYYGMRGIRCRINSKDVKELWFRDRAYLMKNPSLDRRDSTKDYCFENCQFMEMKDNLRKSHIERKTRVATR